ncbi:MAG TPA: MFS transporter [Burkholderiales bacterium]|jgi:predicted MFS family arabinose efflux permease
MSHQRNPLPASFRRLAWSNLLAQAAEQIGLAAAPLVAVLALHAGPGATGWLQTAQTLPFLLIAIPAGLLADRMQRRRLMAGAEAMRAASLLLVLALATLGGLSLPLLALLGFVGACGTVVYGVAAPALVPTLVEREQLPTANARIELARTVAYAGGPALAGLLAGITGAAPAFAFAAALSAAAVVLLAGLREPARGDITPASGNAIDDLREGTRFVFGHALLRPIFLTQVIFAVAFFVLHSVYVPYAVHQLGLPAFAVGATLAAYGGGMVAGALAAPRLMRLLPLGVMVAIGPLAGLAAAALMACTLLFASAWLAGLSYFLMGAGPILWVISTTTLRQNVTPQRLLGRASAINSLSYGARPIGAALGALIGGSLGAGACLIASVIFFGVQAGVILLSPAVRLREQPAPAGA